MSFNLSEQNINSKFIIILLKRKYLISLIVLQLIELHIILISFPFQRLLFDGGDYSIPYLFGNLSPQSISLISYYNILQWIIFQASKNMIIAHNYLNLAFFILLPFSIYASSLEFSNSRFSAFLISISLGTFSNYVTLVFVSGGYEFIGLLLFGFLSIKYLIRNIKLPGRSYRNLTLAGLTLALSALSTFPLGFYVLFPLALLIFLYGLHNHRPKARAAFLHLIYFLVPIVLLLMPSVLTDFYGLNSVLKSPSSTLNYVIATIKYGYAGMDVGRAILNSQPGVGISWSIIVLSFLLLGFLAMFSKKDSNKGLIKVAFFVYFTYSLVIILINKGFTFIITDVPYLWIFDYAGFFQLSQIFSLLIIGTVGVDFLVNLRRKNFEIIEIEESDTIVQKQMHRRIRLNGKYISVIALALIILLISSSYYSSQVNYPGRVVPDASDSFSPDLLGIHSWYEKIAQNYSGEIMFLPNTEPCYNIIASSIPVNRIFNAPFPLPNTVFNYSADIQIYSSIGELNLNLSSALLGAYGTGYLVIVEGQNETILLPAGNPYNVNTQIELPASILLKAINQSNYFHVSFEGNGFIVYSVVPYFSILNTTHPLATINSGLPQSLASGVHVDLNESGSFFGGYPSKNVSIEDGTVNIHGYGTYFLIHVPVVQNLLQNITNVVYSVGFSIRNNSAGRISVVAYFDNKSNPSAIFTSNSTSIASVFSGSYSFVISPSPSFASFTLLFVNDNSSSNSTIRISFPNLTYGYSATKHFNYYSIFDILKEQQVLQSSTVLLPRLMLQQIPNSLQGSMYSIYLTSQLKSTDEGNRSIVNYNNNISSFANSSLYDSRITLDLFFQPNSTGNISIHSASGQVKEFNLSLSNLITGRFYYSSRYIFNFSKEDHLIMVVAILMPNKDINITGITVNLTNPFEKARIQLQPGGYFTINFENIRENYHSLITLTEVDLIILAVIIVFALTDTTRRTLLTILRRYLFKKRV